MDVAGSRADSLADADAYAKPIKGIAQLDGLRIRWSQLATQSQLSKKAAGGG